MVRWVHPYDLSVSGHEVTPQNTQLHGQIVKRPVFSEFTRSGALLRVPSEEFPASLYSEYCYLYWGS